MCLIHNIINKEAGICADDSKGKVIAGTSFTISSFQKSIRSRPFTQTSFTICEKLYVVNTPTFGEIKTGCSNLQSKVLGLSGQLGR
jgi:hypothetical protein